MSKKALGLLYFIPEIILSLPVYILGIIENILIIAGAIILALAVCTTPLINLLFSLIIGRVLSDEITLKWQFRIILGLFWLAGIYICNLLFFSWEFTVFQVIFCLGFLIIGCIYNLNRRRRQELLRNLEESEPCPEKVEPGN